MDKINIDQQPETNVDWFADGERANAAVLNRPIKQVAEKVNELIDEVQINIQDDINSKADSDGTNATGTWPIGITGNAATANTLSTARTIALSGDVTGSVSFNGGSNVTITTVVADDSHNHVISNVDGLQSALDGKLNTSLKGAANGLAELNASGQVPASQLPSYVDDVLEYANFAAFPVTGETGKIYIDIDTSSIYRWTGSAYIQIANDVGTADQANQLATARLINGTSFDGSANITTANWGTSRTLTIGGTGKSVNGSGNVSWSLAEIGVNNSTLTLATSGIATGSQSWTANQGSNSTFTVNVPGTNIAEGTRTTTTVPITSSTGTDAILSAATTSLAGVMSSADKTKLDGIASGAQVNTVTSVFGRTGAVVAQSNDYTFAQIGSKPTTFQGYGISGGDLTSPITYRNIAAGSWARGLEGRLQSDGTLQAGIGILGSSDSVTNAYIGFGSSPWGTGNGIRITASGISMTGTVTGFTGDVSGNSSTATTLLTARTINGTSFDGSANITTANWGTSRTLTIGSTGKSVNGSGNVTWSLAEIGAATTAQGAKADTALQPNTDVVVTQIDVDNIRINGNTISSTNTDGNIIIDPAGAGRTEFVGGSSFTSFTRVLGDYGVSTACIQFATTATNPRLYSFGDFQFFTAAIGGTATEKMRLFGNGNLHIGGTIDPGVRLGVTGNVGVSDTIYTAHIEVNGKYSQNIVAMSNNTINCSLGNYFTRTINANSTFDFSNVPTSRAFGVTLELTHTSGTITWPASVKWPGDNAPTLTAGKTHLFVFVTSDGGTIWRGTALADYTS